MQRRIRKSFNHLTETYQVYGSNVIATISDVLGASILPWWLDCTAQCIKGVSWECILGRSEVQYVLLELMLKEGGNFA